MSIVISIFVKMFLSCNYFIHTIQHIVASICLNRLNSQDFLGIVYCVCIVCGLFFWLEIRILLLGRFSTFGRSPDRVILSFRTLKKFKQTGSPTMGSSGILIKPRRKLNDTVRTVEWF